MSRTDIKNHVSVAQTLAPAARSATEDGVGVDLANFDSAMAVIDVGTAGGATPSFTFEVQHSDDNSAWAPVPDAELDGAEPVITTANDDAIYKIGYRGIKRYLRVAVTAVSGTGPTLPCAATVVRGKARRQPV